MTTWADVLADLERRSWDVPTQDIWFYLTAAGMNASSPAEAEAAVDLVAGYVPDLGTKRVADLGCGSGRHLVGLAAVAAEVVGVESSAPLAEIARTYAAGAQVKHGSLHDLAEHGAFDVVCAFAHCLLLVEDETALVRSLQGLRGAMPDFGLLVIETFPADEGETRWSGAGVAVDEVRTATPTGHRYRFTVRTHGRSSTSELHGLQLSSTDWLRVAEESGFHLEAVQVPAGPFGSTFLFLRATKGFNYLSDLTEFLESWAEPEHPRNHRLVSWVATDTLGRVRPEGDLALGQGASLSKHHPDFSRAIEERVRPLVLEFVQAWNFVTYSSCGGHLVSPGARQVFTEAYCGLVTFDNRQVTTVRRLIEAATEEVDSEHVEVGVRVRTLHGATSALTAADVLFRRRSFDTSWDDYAAGVSRVVQQMVNRLAVHGGRR